MTKLEVFRDDEFYLIQRDGVYHIYGMWNGKRIRRSCRTKDLTKAKIELDSLKRECLSGWRPNYDGPDDWLTIAGAMHRRHRRSAIERDIPFELEVPEIYDLMRSTDFRCAISGVSFSKQAAEGAWRDPWAPSIDRIENRHGYAFDNVRVVSLIANTAMNAWGYDTLLRLARGIVRSASSVSAETEEVAHGRHAKTHQSAQVIELKGQSE